MPQISELVELGLDEHQRKTILGFFGSIDLYALTLLRTAQAASLLAKDTDARLEVYAIEQGARDMSAFTSRLVMSLLASHPTPAHNATNTTEADRSGPVKH